MTLLRVQGMPDAMYLVEGIKLALESVGYDKLTREDVNKGLHNVKNLDTMGLTPPVTVDSKWPVICPYSGMSIINNGVVKELASPTTYKSPGITRRLVIGQ